jgi:hypothetical protein
MAIHETFGKGYTNKPNDNIFTPKNISKQIIDLYDLNGIVLDAFRGNGSFYNQYPNHIKKDWCEISEGKDFFKYKNKVDWILTNPPYSIFNEILEHSFTIADNIVYLVPLSKVVSSMGRIRKILNYGNIKSIHIISASKCGFPFGFPACAIHIKKGYKGETIFKEFMTNI